MIRSVDLSILVFFPGDFLYYGHSVVGIFVLLARASF